MQRSPADGDLWPWERNDPEGLRFRIGVRLLDKEWELVERGLEKLDTDAAREVLYRVQEQLGSG